ncbi:MAG: hypothetical protein HKN94_10985 [Acidimicrobiales bacterium]|nr:hypothetical protein [Acidimicrobiales bacterium]
MSIVVLSENAEADGLQGHYCDGKQATIVGTEQNDVLLGTAGPDVIVGLGGNDVLRGLGGNDTLCGDNGRDKLFGGDGNDRLFGGKKNDILKGDFGRDHLFGNQGNDRLFGGPGRDALTGGSGMRDRLYGKGGLDTCTDPQSDLTTLVDTCEVVNVQHVGGVADPDPGLDADSLHTEPPPKGIVEVTPSFNKDSDSDFLSDGLEDWIANTFKPYYWFDENEMPCINPRDPRHWRIMYQVSPWPRSEWDLENNDEHRYQQGAVLTLISMYMRDCGVDDTPNWIPESAEHKHNGDTERVRVYVLGTPENEWSVNHLDIKRHHDAPKDYLPSRVAPGAWPQSGHFAYALQSHPLLLVSQWKHATYTTHRECETYKAEWEGLRLADFENCSGGDYLNPRLSWSQNVGERHEQLVDSLQINFRDGTTGWAGERAWATGIGFCGGLVRSGCTSDIAGKWWHIPAAYTGTWHSNINNWTYTISERHQHNLPSWLEWSQPNIGEVAYLEHLGYDIVAKTSFNGSEIARGRVMALDADGVPTQIRWSNGYWFWRPGFMPNECELSPNCVEF